jgi:N6-adenosine-specific RNA methylase IME4
MGNFKLIVCDPPWSFKDSLKMSDVARGAAANYNTLSIDEIKKLQISSLSDSNGCLLALWVPSSILQDGLDVMKAWGFTHKQTYVWVKVKKYSLQELTKQFSKDVRSALKAGGWDAFQAPDIKKIFEKTSKLFSLTEMLAFGMGRLFRQTHEVCLIGINNNKIYKHLNNKSQRSVCFSQNLKHSAKPDDLQKSLDLMFPSFSKDQKLEIFARRDFNGWTCIGNQCPSSLNEDIRDSIKKIIGG